MAEYYRKQVISSSRWISFTAIFISFVPYGVLQSALQPYTGMYRFVVVCDLLLSLLLVLINAVKHCVEAEMY